MTLATDLINLETRAARLAAVLDARADLGALWRRMVALTEAAASLSLEHIMVAEPDILRPRLGLGTIRGEPQSARTAQAIYRVMLRPGAILREPGAIFDHCIKAARMADLVDLEEGGRVEYPDDFAPEDWTIARESFAAAVRRIRQEPMPVLLRALAIARAAALVMPERQPIAERLIFMAAESDLRRDLAFSDPIVARNLDGLDARVDAGWTAPPSIALARGGFRAWSPATRTGWDALIERLSATLAQEVGRMVQLHAWSEKLDADFRGQTGKSRRADFGQLLRETPILNARVCAKALDVTERTARNLLDDAEAMGIVSQLTSRRSYRIWGVPALAQMIRDRGRIRAPDIAARAQRGDEEEAPRLRAADPDFDRRIDALMGDVDSALKGIDEVIERYRTLPNTR